MKLTESKLRSMIREERRKLEEEKSFRQITGEITDLVDEAYENARRRDDGKLAIKYATALIEKAVSLILEAEVTSNVPSDQTQKAHRELTTVRVALDSLLNELE